MLWKNTTIRRKPAICGDTSSTNPYQPRPMIDQRLHPSATEGAASVHIYRRSFLRRIVDIATRAKAGQQRLRPIALRKASTPNFPEAPRSAGQPFLRRFGGGDWPARLVREKLFRRRGN